MNNPAPKPTTERLINSLRARIQRSYVGSGKWAEIPDPLCQEAAFEIERLRKELADLREQAADAADAWDRASA